MVIISFKQDAYESIAMAYVICDTQTINEISLIREVDVCQKAVVANILEMSEHILHRLFHVSETEMMLINKNKNKNKMLFRFSSLRILENVIARKAATTLIAIPEKAPINPK